MSAQDLQKGEHFHILGAFSQSHILDATLSKYSQTCSYSHFY